MSRRRALLVLNAGSSSLKFQVFELTGDGAPRPWLRGQIEGLPERPRFRLDDAAGPDLEDVPMLPEAARDDASRLAFVRQRVDERLDGAAIVAAGHRVVHGGARHAAPVRADAALIEELQALVPLAPLHQPFNIAPMRALLEAEPALPQVACFDTAFHRHHEPRTQLLGLPFALHEAGLRRYGFHGLSYEYVAGRLASLDPALAQGRVVVAHLGSGASMCALRAARSVDTTMGFSALHGVPMGTRPGSLDAGAVLWLMRERGMDAEALERLLYRESGLLGVSGVSNDMRALLASDAPRARLAVDWFSWRCAQELAAMATSLGGLDALVFTAGIGENSPEIRARLCEHAAWLGIELDDAANVGRAPRIDTRRGGPSVWVVPTDEESMIARHTRDVLGL
jgi:acetate kinase